MLPKLQRFTTQLFDKVFKRTKKVRTKNGLFLISPTKHQPKFAVVVSKKITKKAVQRNKLRRQIYSVFREQLTPYIKDKNVIFLYKAAPVLHSTQDLESDIQTLITYLKNKS